MLFIKLKGIKAIIEGYDTKNTNKNHYHLIFGCLCFDAVRQRII
jgi:hypothetical protein